MISIMQDQANQQLESQIDNNEYEDSQLIEIRVTMHMPYQERFTDFERHYGEITIDGKIYNYVKRKIDGDVLVLKCIPNQTKQELNALKNEWTKANNGIDTDHPGKQQQYSSIAKNFQCDYDGQHHFNTLTDFSHLSSSAISAYPFNLTEGINKTPYLPPKS